MVVRWEEGASPFYLFLVSGGSKREDERQTFLTMDDVSRYSRPAWKGTQTFGFAGPFQRLPAPRVFPGLCFDAPIPIFSQGPACFVERRRGLKRTKCRKQPIAWLPDPPDCPEARAGVGASRIEFDLGVNSMLTLAQEEANFLDSTNGTGMADS